MRAKLKLQDKDLLISKLSEQLAKANETAELGSIQRKGEAQELVLEAYLREQFPIDQILEIGKGNNGADCVSNCP